MIENLKAKGFSDKDILKLFSKKEKELVIPIGVFQNRSLGLLESLTLHLKDRVGLSYHQIAVILNRDDRTIWTSYNQAKKKLKTTKFKSPP